MPTYQCIVPPKLLNAAQKQEMAQTIVRIHCKATGAPHYYAQVIIDESDQRVRYLGGKPQPNHIWIRADIRSGRSAEVKGKLMLDMMRAVSKISGVDETMVFIYLNELEGPDIVEYGEILPGHGHEQTWFATLSPARQKLMQSYTMDE